MVASIMNTVTVINNDNYTIFLLLFLETSLFQ